MARPNTNDINKPIRDNFKQARINSGFTMRQIAEMLDIKFDTLKTWAQNQDNIAKRDKLARLKKFNDTFKEPRVYDFS